MPVGIGYKGVEAPKTEFFQLPFNELLAGLSAKQKQFDEVSEKASALEALAPVGGYRTEDRASALKNKLFTKAAEFQEKLAKGDTSILPEIKSFAQRYVTDPEYIDVKADELARPLADKQLVEGNFPEYAQSWYDVNNKKAIQTKPGERFSAEWYQSMSPKDWLKEYQDNASLLKPLYENIATVGFTKLDESTGQLYRETENGSREYLDENRLKEFLDPKGPHGAYVKTLYDARKEGHLFREAKEKQVGRDYPLERFALDNLNANLIRMFDKTTTSKSAAKIGDGTSGSKKTEKENNIVATGMDVSYTVNPQLKGINTEQDVQRVTKELTSELTEYKNVLNDPESDLNKLFYGMFDNVPLPLKEQSLGTIIDNEGNEIVVDKLPVINKDGIEYADVEKLKTYAQYIAPENKDKFINQLDNITQYNLGLERANNNLTGFNNIIQDLKLSAGFNKIPEKILERADKVYEAAYKHSLYLKQEQGILSNLDTEKNEKEARDLAEKKVMKFLEDESPNAKKYYEGLKALSSPSDIAGKAWMLAGFTSAEATAANGLTTYAKGRLTGVSNTTDIKFTKGNKPIHEHPDFEKKILPAINNFLQDAIGEEGESSANKMKNNTKLRWDEQDGWMLDVYIPGLREGAPDQNTIEIPINENDATQMSLVTNLFGNTNVQFGNNLQKINADINDFGFFKDDKLNYSVITTNKITATDKGLYQNIRNVTGKLDGIEIKFNSVVDATQFYTDLKDFKTFVKSDDQYIRDGNISYYNTPEIRQKLFYETFSKYGLNELKLKSIYNKNFQ
jgi:hypothetical protein